MGIKTAHYIRGARPSKESEEPEDQGMGGFRRSRDRNLRESALQIVAEPLLVIRVGEGKQQAYRDRGRATVPMAQARRDPVTEDIERGVGQGLHDPAEVIHAFQDAEAVGPGDQRRRANGLKVVRIFFVCALQVRNVFEPGGRDVHNARAPTGQQGVRGERRAQDERRCVLQRAGQAFQGIENRRCRVGWC